MGDGGKYFSAMSEREREALKREAQLRKYIYIYILVFLVRRQLNMFIDSGEEIGRDINIEHTKGWGGEVE